MSDTDTDGVIPPERGANRGGPPPLRPFGLVLWRDGTWTHEGQPILNRRLREKFDRSVVYLADEDAYVVQIGRFRGQIEIEETGFFVRSVDLDEGSIHLSDESVERLDVDSLTLSEIDGALIGRIKRDTVPGGLPARFCHSAQADFLAGVDDTAGPLSVRLGGGRRPLPPGVLESESD